jgi:molecular chaperone HtpG
MAIQIIEVKIDKDAKTLTIKDQGIGMTGEEVEKYINRWCFPEQKSFWKNIKIRLKIPNYRAFWSRILFGFYGGRKSGNLTKSYKDDAKAVRWICDGSPNIRWKMQKNLTEEQKLSFILQKILQSFWKSSKSVNC